MFVWSIFGGPSTPKGKSSTRWSNPSETGAPALKLMRKLLSKYAFVPEAVGYGRSYSAAVHVLGIERRHERGRCKNNRAENSHRSTRRREGKMQRFKNPGSAQKFLSTHAAVYYTFNVQRRFTSPQTHRELRAVAMATWRTASQQPENS
jgi:putative transposase